MKRSTERILTTHCGSLPRPADLLNLMKAKVHGEPAGQLVELAVGEHPVALDDRLGGRPAPHGCLE